MIIKFLLFILIIFFIILLLGVGFISRFVRVFNKRPDSTNSSNKRYSRSNQERENDSPYTSAGHQKIFGKDEGEYTDYEEIK